MLSNHSPDKQNRSPQAENLLKKTNKKIGQTQNQLLCYAFKNCSPSPSHRKQDNLHSYQCQFKLIDCDQNQEIFKIKALLADRDFQVKKLQQDFAEYKLHSRMEKQKALRKLRDQLQNQKKKHVDQVKKWQSKFEQMKGIHQRQLKKYKTEIQEYYKKHEQIQLTNLRDKYQKELKLSNHKYEMIQQQFKMTCKQLIKKNQMQLKELKLAHQKQKQNLKKLHTEEIKKTEQIFQIKVFQVQIQKQSETKLVEETKKQTIKKEEKYLTQIGIIQREKKVLVQKTDQMEMKYKVMNKRYEDKLRQIQTLKNQYQNQITELNGYLQTLRSQTQQTIENEKLRILKQEYEKTQKLQDKLMNLKQLKQKIVDYHQTNQKVLEYKFERRESRKEDTDIIKEIQTELAYKQRQKKRLYEYLRLAQLQRQNDDKIYTRIFTSSRSKRKSSANCNNSDIYSILKQSHTTDFRHLLKISKKDNKQNPK